MSTIHREGCDRSRVDDCDCHLHWPNSDAESHNPRRIKLDVIPSGWRLLKRGEVDGRFKGVAQLWDWTVSMWNLAKDADDLENTYIVPINPQDVPTGVYPITAEHVSDPINPDHYKRGAIECIEAIKASMSRVEFQGYLKGQVFKYNWRMGLKGSAVEDSRKAAWYQNRLTLELEDSNS